MNDEDFNQKLTKLQEMSGDLLQINSDLQVIANGARRTASTAPADTKIAFPLEASRSGDLFSPRNNYSWRGLLQCR